MANLFLNIPVPAANGAGAAVDVSATGRTKSFVCGGGFLATVNVEYSNELVPTVWAPLATFLQSGNLTIDIAAHWLRARTSDYRSGNPNLDVGANDAGSVFAQLDAIGTPVDIADFPLLKTVVAPSGFIGQIEVSEDGTDWAQVFSFQQGGGITREVVAQFARCIGNGVPVWIGGANESSGGGGGGGEISAGNVLTFRPGGGDIGPVVFDDWAALYAQLLVLRSTAAESGLYWIVFDDAVDTITIPSGTYDMTGVSWTGRFFWEQRTNISMIGSVEHLAYIRGLDIDTSAGGRVHIMAGKSLKLEHTSFDNEEDGEAIVAEVGAAQLEVGDASDPAGIIIQPSNGGFSVFLSGAECASPSLFGDPTTDVTIGVSSSSVVDYNLDSGGFSGTLTIIQGAAIAKAQGDPNGIVAAAQGTLLIDTNLVPGTIYKNSDGGTTWAIFGGGAPTTEHVSGVGGVDPPQPLDPAVDTSFILNAGASETSQVFTLGDGTVDGQIHNIVNESTGIIGVTVTPDNLFGGTSIGAGFSNASASLIWNATLGEWQILGEMLGFTLS